VAAYEVLLLNTAIPQIQAAQAGDTYVVPRDIAINATAIISANSAADALRITQTGAGNALLVEDAANPDSSPFVVTATGDVGIGTASPGAKLAVQGGEVHWGQSGAFGFLGTGGGNTAAIGSIGARDFLVFTNSAERMRLDSSGNLGLGVTPSGWGSNYRVLDIVQFGTRTASLVGGSGQTGIGLALGVYHNNTNWIATVSSAPVARYEIDGVGNHSFFTYNGTVTAGATISFTQAMTLDSSGNLGIGVTSPLTALSFPIGTSKYVGQTQLTAHLAGNAGSMGFGIADGGGQSGVFFHNTHDGTFSSQDIRFLTAKGGVSLATERMRLDSSGNLGLGVTPSAWTTNWKAFQFGATSALSDFSNQSSFWNNTVVTGGTTPSYQTTAAASFYRQTGGQHLWYNAPSGTAGNAITFTQAMTLDASGNLALGATSATLRADIIGSGTVTSGTMYGVARIAQDNTTKRGVVFGYDTSGQIGTIFTDSAGAASNLAFWTYSGSAWGERARITSGGNLLVKATSSSATSDVGFKLNPGGGDEQFAIVIDTSTAAQTPITVYNINATNNGYRFYVRADGGVANYQANDVNLSDQRTKKDIVAAPSYWDKIKGIEIVHFKYKDQTHDDNNVGVIAQQVEQVAPEFVDQDGWGETPEDGVPLKSIYTSDMYHAAIKALQEAMARIEKLEAEVAALKGV
jgi:hypothetical protein